MSDYVIISRHPATIEWLKRNPSIPKDTPIVIGNASAVDVAGKVVIGNLPLSLASMAKAILAVEFTGTPPRGMDYSIEDMLMAGATLKGYIVYPFSQLDLID